MKKRNALPWIAAALLATALPAFAADTAPSGLRADIQRNIDDASGKLMELAAAVPADKYGWRPAAGVRSMSGRRTSDRTTSPSLESRIDSAFDNPEQNVKKDANIDPCSIACYT